MTREELKEHCKKQIENCEMWARHYGEEPHGKVYEEHKLILELLEQEPILDKLKDEINKNIEQEDFARYVFLYEEKDLDRANKCVGILEAYKKVLDMINNLLKENKDEN